MKFKFSFYLDKRFKYENGEHSIKVNCYSLAQKKQYHFRIKPVIFPDGSKFVVSCKSQKEFESVWIKKDKLDNFGEKVGETTVYGDKLKLRTVLKDKQDQLNDIISRDNITTIENVKDAFYNYVKPVNYSNNVYIAFESYIKKLGDEHRYSTATSYQTTLNNLRRYNNNLPFMFEDVTVDWLELYDRNRRKVVAVDSLGIDMRNLRAVYNSVKEDLAHLIKMYPFKKGSYSIPKGESKNQSLNSDQIKTLLKFTSDNFYLQMARDYWVFSYINRGMNLTDVAYLEKGQKEFIRKKTEFTAKKVVKGKVQDHPTLDEITKRHSGTGKYLFDIIDDYDSPEVMHKKIKNKISSLNKQYKNLARLLNFPSSFSYQWARHSYSTNMIRSNVNIKAVSESMNHTSIRTTENYLDTLRDENEKNINKALGIWVIKNILKIYKILKILKKVVNI